MTKPVKSSLTNRVYYKSVTIYIYIPFFLSHVTILWYKSADFIGQWPRDGPKGPWEDDPNTTAGMVNSTSNHLVVIEK